MQSVFTVSFHSQQCIEKYLKACLQEENIGFIKTHDLSILLELFLPIKPDWRRLYPTLDALTTYAIEFRYPGSSATKALATEAFQNCVSVRQIIRQHFAL